MPIDSFAAGLRSRVFQIHLLLSLTAKVGIMFLFGWGMFSRWGAVPSARFEPIYFARWNPDVGTCVVFDTALGLILMPFFLTFFGSLGTRRAVRKGACEPVSSQLLDHAAWQWTPLRFRSPIAQAVAAVVWSGCVVGVPVLAGFYACFGSTQPIEGLQYLWLKTLWVVLLTPFLQVFGFFGGADERLFETPPRNVPAKSLPGSVPDPADEALTPLMSLNSEV